MSHFSSSKSIETMDSITFVFPFCFPVVEEYTKECQKELDFCLEAESMQHVKELLQRRNIRAIVPEVITELVTEKVLVMEYCQGFPIRDLESLD
jgi:predicted unusual protein kinase regulating ubiquinone biosynthesis (AarF/ABC1/UbiB family)